MKYMVSWVPGAQNELANIWNNATDRQAVTDAANLIDRDLTRNPESKGQSWQDGRVYVVPPLLVTFEIAPDDCRVWVLEVERV